MFQDAAVRAIPGKILYDPFRRVHNPDEQFVHCIVPVLGQFFGVWVEICNMEFEP